MARVVTLLALAAAQRSRRDPHVIDEHDAINAIKFNN
jgi:hypothetical protein